MESVRVQAEVGQARSGRQADRQVKRVKSGGVQRDTQAMIYN